MNLELIEQLHESESEATISMFELIDIIQKHRKAGKNNIALNQFFDDFCKHYRLDMRVNYHDQTCTLSSRYRREQREQQQKAIKSSGTSQKQLNHDTRKRPDEEPV